ncbi:hypothetical protein [Chamaesiphon sp. VAR_48_metabat_135_sub]|uniref:tetratricopeptide repeat protein n=1 Tax=Chamaesiphon sp. VAR_48_metabat_135_sub TaxID=2964699 RepID=UPI00286BF925|nr:hypothetical protein [Chamaesiphon sp. VAR_48_metabat_135_sub]
MHLFNDIFQSFCDDLTKICYEIEDFLFADWCPTDRSTQASRDLPRMLADYNRAIQSTPTDANLFYGRGTIRHYSHDNIGAIADYDLAISIDPQLAQAYAARSVSYRQLDRLTDALSDSNRAIELNPQLAFAFHARANHRSFTGEHDGAIADFSRYTQLDPGATSYYNLGVSQATIACYNSALVSLSKSINLRPKIATYYARSVTLANLGDEFGADRDYSKALSLETPGSGSLSASDEHAYYFRALARLARAKRTEAIADLQRTLDICDLKNNSYLQQIARDKIAEIERT